MAKVRVLVLRAAGINCDEETVHAWQLAGAAADCVHVNRVCERPDLLDRADILTIPGGFSFGDDIAAGRILATRLRLRLADRLRAFVERERLVLGICNGFQVLVKTGLLPANDAGGACTLAANANGHYLCRWVTLRGAVDHCVFIDGGREYFLPVAHAEGRFAVAPKVDLDPRRVGLRYVPGATSTGPANPNGSVDDVAALTDATGRIMGMMPHPDRFLHPTQHPYWTALDRLPEPDGLAIFRSAVAAMA